MYDICIYKHNINIFNISSPENNDSTKLVISVRAGDKPPAGRNTNSVVIIFWASYVIYSIAPRIPPGSAHGDKTVASCFVVCVHRLCVSVSAALSSVSLYLKSMFLYQKYGNRQAVLLDVYMIFFCLKSMMIS